MKRAYLGLGSNVGDRKATLQSALEKLQDDRLHVVKQSSLYETEPIGYLDQGWFLNMAVEIETSLFPMMLLKRVQAVERELGRRRIIDKGPRTIDIDILLYERFVIDTPQLKIPHTAMTERRFVLAPMHDLAPDLRHPVIKRTMRELLAALKGQAVRKLEP